MTSASDAAWRRWPLARPATVATAPQGETPAAASVDEPPCHGPCLRRRHDRRPSRRRRRSPCCATPTCSAASQTPTLAAAHRRQRDAAPQARRRHREVRPTLLDGGPQAATRASASRTATAPFACRAPSPAAPTPRDARHACRAAGCPRRRRHRRRAAARRLAGETSAGAAAAAAAAAARLASPRARSLRCVQTRR